MTGRRQLVGGLAGAAIAAAHLAALPVLIGHCKRDSLEVKVRSPPAAEALDISAQIPRGIAKRSYVTVDDTPTALESAKAGPGLHHVEWRVRYRGGFQRRVGTTQLVGPFQNPAKLPCSTRLVVGQSLLDDGRDTPGTIAHLAKRQIDAQMKGFKQWPLGSFKGASNLSIEWVRLEDRPALMVLLSKARSNRPDVKPESVSALLAIKLRLDFDRGGVPVFIGVSPALTGPREIDLRVFSHAELDFDSRFFQLLSDLFKGDKLANKTAQQEINSALTDIFTAPLPVPLPGGRKLHFDYCTGEGIDIVTGKYAVLPLAMRLDGALDHIRPVTLGRAPSPHARPGAPLSFEFDLDAINAVLYYLWRTRFLDEELAKAKIPERFNKDPRVDKLLSVRIDDLSLTLPPTATPRAGAYDFTLAAAAQLTVRDGNKTTPGRVFSAIGFRFGTTGDKLVADLELADLRLTCEPTPGRLVPCYSDIVAQIRDNADDLHGELTRLFTSQFNRIVLNRSIGGPGLPHFEIRRAEVQAIRTGATGLVRVSLFGGMDQ